MTRISTITRESIGGTLDYRRLAELHRPTDPALIAAEIHRLAISGLKAVDIGEALRIDPVLVLQTLRGTP